ncbi:MAG: hypothetical protein ACN6RD_15250, partial [Stenotrophomonas maltophilia]
MVRLYDPDRIGEIEHLSIAMFQIDAGEPPFGDYIDFVGAVYEDIHVDWIHPDSGRRYALLDLDWEYSLGIGRSFIQFEEGSGYDLERSVQALGAACGQRMTYARRVFQQRMPPRVEPPHGWLRAVPVPSAATHGV